MLKWPPTPEAAPGQGFEFPHQQATQINSVVHTFQLWCASNPTIASSDGPSDLAHESTPQQTNVTQAAKIPP